MALNKSKIAALLTNTADLSLKRKAGVIFERLAPQPEDRILEVGSGDGYYPAILNQTRQYKYVGLELDRNAIDSAERNLQSLKLTYQRPFYLTE